LVENGGDGYRIRGEQSLEIPAGDQRQGGGRCLLTGQGNPGGAFGVDPEALSRLDRGEDGKALAGGIGPGLAFAGQMDGPLAALALPFW